MRALDLIQELSARRSEVEEFIAPILGSGTIDIYQNGIPLRLNINSKKVGWYKFKVDGLTALPVTEASAIEIRKWWQDVRMTRFVVGPVMDAATRSRLCLPFGVPNPTPLVVSFIPEDVQYLSMIEAGQVGNWVYKDVKRRDPVRDYLIDLLNKNTEKLTSSTKGLTVSHKMMYDMVVNWLRANDPAWKKISKEDALRKIAKDENATVDFIRKSGKNYIVRFTTASGESTTATIDGDSFMTRTAGFCLSGGDRNFSFSTLVALLNKRRSRW